MTEQAQAGKEVYGRVVEWVDSDNYGRFPLTYQYGYIRDNPGNRYLVQFKDISGTEIPPSKGMVLKGILVDRGVSGSERLINVEVL